MLSAFYFTFALPYNMVREQEVVDVKFQWNIKGFEMSSQKRFRVVAVSSVGLVETSPFLSDVMPVRFSGLSGVENQIQLNFRVIDTITGVSYQTPVKNFWGPGYYKKYSDLLNQSLSTASINKGPIPKISIRDRRNPTKIYIWYLAPALFLAGLLKSPHGFG